MALHIGRMTTDMEVLPERAATSGSDDAARHWSEHDRLAIQLDRLTALRARTRAMGFDD